MNFIFSWSTRYLTRSLRSLVRYRVDHSKIKFISTRGHVISSIYSLSPESLRTMVLMRKDVLYECVKTRGGAEDSWNFRIWIIQQKVTSHPVSTEPRRSFYKAKKWRFDLPRFSSICNPSGSLPIKLRVGSCCRHVPSTLKLKLLAKDNISLLFWRKITESLLSSNGGFYTFAKLMLFRLLVLVIRDWVITLSEIAHDVRNDLDEVLLAMVCTVYNGNIDNRSRFSLKVGVSELCIHMRVVEKTSWIVYSRSVSYFRISCWILFSL